MRRTARPFVAALCATLLVLGSAANAHADDFSSVFAAYKKAGAIDGCKFTPQQLKNAKSQIPNDFKQYAPDFKDAIDAAAKQRASGACEKKTASTSTSTTTPAATSGGSGTSAGGSTPAAPTASTPAAATSTPAAAPATTAAATPQPTPSATPAAAVSDGAILAAAKNTDGNGGVPAPLIALAVLALLAALAALAVATVRWLAFEPPWLVRSRHATAEAGWRTSAAWAEFTDWLRLGR